MGDPHLLYRAEVGPQFFDGGQMWVVSDAVEWAFSGGCHAIDDCFQHGWF